MLSVNVQSNSGLDRDGENTVLIIYLFHYEQHSSNSLYKEYMFGKQIFLKSQSFTPATIT